MGTVLLDTGLRRTDLASGLVVLSEAMPGVRSVATGIFVRTASAHERRAQMGVSHLLEHMVFKGTERRSARQLALELEVRGARSTPLPGATTPVSRPTSWTKIFRLRSTSSPIWCAARCSTSGISSRSGTSSSRRSTACSIRPTSSQFGPRRDREQFAGRDRQLAGPHECRQVTGRPCAVRECWLWLVRSGIFRNLPRQPVQSFPAAQEGDLQRLVCAAGDHTLRARRITPSAPIRPYALAHGHVPGVGVCLSARPAATVVILPS